MKKIFLLIPCFIATLLFGQTSTVTVNMTTKATQPPVGILNFEGATSFGITRGSGNPNGIVTMTPGSMYLDKTGAIWFKQTGIDSSGWSQLGTGGGSPAPSTNNLLVGNGMGGISNSGISPFDVSRLSLPNVWPNVNTFLGIRLGQRTVSSDYTLSVVNCAVSVDATSGPVHVYLPAALGSGQFYYIQKADLSGNTVTVVPKIGDQVNDQPVWLLSNQYDDLTVRDGALGGWAKVGAGVGEIPDVSDFASQSQQNTFTDLNQFTGVQFSSQVVMGDYAPTTTDFAILADATIGSVNHQLPPATGSGQIYYFEKIDNTDGVVTISRSGSDLIGGSVSINFVDQHANVTLLDSAPGYWSNMGSPTVSTSNTAQTNVGWWYRPEITNDNDLKTQATIGQPLNSRIDVLYPDGLRIYVLYYGPADVTDPRQVAPNDYNVSYNNVRWIQKL